MATRPSVPEIITVNSEELQTLVRDLLPSQNGFGSELQATNVITPIIDLTATAEGSTLRSDLQTALAFGSQTAFNFNNSNGTILNSPGFYRIVGTAVVNAQTTERSADISMTDGATTKIVWALGSTSGGSNDRIAVNIDLVLWLASGISVTMTADEACTLSGSTRQIADSAGAFVQPVGYPL